MKKNLLKFDTTLLQKEQMKKITGGCSRTDYSTLNGKRTNHHDKNDTDTTADTKTDYCEE